MVYVCWHGNQYQNPLCLFLELHRNVDNLLNFHLILKPLKFPYNRNLSISVSVPADLPEGRGRWAAGGERTDGSGSTFRDRRLDQRRSRSEGLLWGKGLWVFMLVCFDAWASSTPMFLGSLLWSYRVNTWRAELFKEHINNVTLLNTYYFSWTSMS